MTTRTRRPPMLDVQTLLLIDSFLESVSKQNRLISKITAQRVVLYRLSRYTRQDCGTLIRNTLESWGLSSIQPDLDGFLQSSDVGCAVDPERQGVDSSLGINDTVGWGDADKKLDLGTICLFPNVTLARRSVSVWCSKLIFKRNTQTNNCDAGVIALFAYPREQVDRDHYQNLGDDSLESMYQLRVARDIAQRLKNGVVDETDFAKNYGIVKNDIEDQSRRIGAILKDCPHISLCLDGGGARGQLSASILCEVIRRVNADDWVQKTFQSLDVVEIFDDIHGTSAGAIIGSALWSELYPLSDIPWEFYKISRTLFSGGPTSSLFSFAKVGSGATESFYSASPVNKEIIRNLSFWEAKASPLLQPIFPMLCLHATDVTQTVYFPIKVNTHDATVYTSADAKPVAKDLKLADYVRASMAAPGYLTVYPVAATSEAEHCAAHTGEPELVVKQIGMIMADGGILNNNPGLSSLCQNLAKVVPIPTSQLSENGTPVTVPGLTILSIGTGYKLGLQTQRIAKIQELTKLSAQTTNDELHLRMAAERDPTEFSFNRIQLQTSFDALDEPRIDAYREWRRQSRDASIAPLLNKAAADILKVLRLKEQLIQERRSFRSMLLTSVERLTPERPREVLKLTSEYVLQDLDEPFGERMRFDGTKLMRRSALRELIVTAPSVKLIDAAIDGTSLRHSPHFYRLPEDAADQTRPRRLCSLKVSTNHTEWFYLGWAVGGPAFRTAENMHGRNSLLSVVTVKNGIQLQHPLYSCLRICVDLDGVYILTDDKALTPCTFALTQTNLTEVHLSSGL